MTELHEKPVSGKAAGIIILGVLVAASCAVFGYVMWVRGESSTEALLPVEQPEASITPIEKLTDLPASQRPQAEISAVDLFALATTHPEKARALLVAPSGLAERMFYVSGTYTETRGGPPVEKLEGAFYPGEGFELWFATTDNPKAIRVEPSNRLGRIWIGEPDERLIRTATGTTLDCNAKSTGLVLEGAPTIECSMAKKSTHAKLAVHVDLETLTTAPSLGHAVLTACRAGSNFPACKVVTK